MEESTLCDEYSPLQRAYYDYGLPLLFSVGLVSIIPGVFQFIRAFLTNKLNSTATSFYLGIVYLFIYILFSSTMIITYSTRCRQQDVQAVTDFVAYYLYFIQFELFTIILFHKLVSIFADTAFAVSTTRIIIYAILLLLGMTMASVGYAAFMLAKQTSWSTMGFLLWGAGSVLSIAIMIWLNIMFIRKLSNVAMRSCSIDNHVASGDTKKEDELNTIITKTSVLCFIGTWMTILCVLFVMILNSIDPTHKSIDANFMLFREILIFSDLYTNFLTVLLSFSYFDAWYFRLCGCCHQRLKRCCRAQSMAAAKNMEMMHKEVASQSSSVL